jgi:hypothetical protein
VANISPVEVIAKNANIDKWGQNQTDMDQINGAEADNTNWMEFSVVNCRISPTCDSGFRGSNCQ